MRQTKNPPASERRESRAAAPPAPNPSDVARLLAGVHDSPHSILGAHPVSPGGEPGVVIRAWHPVATGVDCIPEGGEAVAMQRVEGGLFAVFLPRAAMPIRYRLRFQFAGGSTWERDDPYRFLPTIGDIDLHLFNEGTHQRLWEMLGAHPRTLDGVAGVSFAVWAPNAKRVSVIGEFCGWDGRLFPMRQVGASGVFELFVPGLAAGTLYKYELLTREGLPRVKTDPMAFKMEQAPQTASIVTDLARYAWNDDLWMRTRRDANPLREPMLIYECHLGSWARVPEDNNRSLTYREIAPKLVEHVKALGFTHIELLPIMEHPFTGSWGYQVTGYYAPTSRFGSPDDFKFLVDSCHQADIGVILDWVPAHFPKDDWALRQFDGTALYEHEDPRLGEHPDWGTLIFNYGRNEVRNFLVANALYWLDEFHADGLRVDAVASMLYLDYSREPGQWLRNRHGGRENLEAIDFLRQVTETVRTEQPGCITIAEESTAWPGVTKPVSEGGLGFTFKWNMGWMHDTLKYFETDPLYRRWHQDTLTFAMMYEYSEHFIMPLSHDEVVHLKKSLLEKMPGDDWQKLANLRALLAYQYTRPGKSLLFMGTELAQSGEWNHDSSLDWHLVNEPRQRGLMQFMRDLGRIYNERAPLWRRDHEPEGFSWIDVADRDNSVISYVRRDGTDHVVVVLNLTPIPREEYTIGAPAPVTYVQLLSSDDAAYGGSGYRTRERVETERAPMHGYQQSMRLTLPPLGALVLVPA
ncbi:MAG TPA: 1,4-alpha-glucan branching protein GlgB [Gemmatimonadaceae bacterium]|nr:1,4-alpha-glucan branching protein GlgB [Gemmatimonadaceae bacterium]